jgi:hypothetical protein
MTKEESFEQRINYFSSYSSCMEDRIKEIGEFEATFLYLAKIIYLYRTNGFGEVLNYETKSTFNSTFYNLYLFGNYVKLGLGLGNNEGIKKEIKVSKRDRLTYILEQELFESFGIQL